MAGIAYYKRLQKRYLPFALICWTGLVNESTSYYLIMNQGNNLANSNIYTLIEFLLFLWLFYRINNRKAFIYCFAALAGCTVWAADNIFMHAVDEDNNLFRILSFAIILLLSMDKISGVISGEHRQPYKKTDLLLCISFFAYYAYQGFVTTFNMFPMGVSTEFYTQLWLLLSITNLITNIVYTVAILWIPKQQPYTLHL